jgi:thermostable 8-oxoguanine DNA glycosylase
MMKKGYFQTKLFTWIFYFLSVGMLISGGIFIEKIILTRATTADIFKALVFCVLGAGISAFVTFRTRQEG